MALLGPRLGQLHVCQFPALLQALLVGKQPVGGRWLQEAANVATRQLPSMTFGEVALTIHALTGLAVAR